MAAAPNELRSACDVCHRHCSLAPGQTGACRARTNVGGLVAPSAYGRLTSIAIDPIEKKPLAFDEVRALLAQKARDGFKDQIKAILERHGSAKLSELAPSAYEAVVAEAEALGNG